MLAVTSEDLCNWSIDMIMPFEVIEDAWYITDCGLSMKYRDTYWDICPYCHRPTNIEGGGMKRLSVKLGYESRRSQPPDNG